MKLQNQAGRGPMVSRFLLRVPLILLCHRLVGSGSLVSHRTWWGVLVSFFSANESFILCQRNKEKETSQGQTAGCVTVLICRQFNSNHDPVDDPATCEMCLSEIRNVACHAGRRDRHRKVSTALSIHSSTVVNTVLWENSSKIFSSNLRPVTNGQSQGNCSISPPPPLLLFLVFLGK